MSNYNKAVQILSKRITGRKSSLDNQKRNNLARELLQTEKPQNHNEWKNIEIDLNPGQTQVMAQYAKKLRESYNHKIGKNIQNTLEKVEQTTNLRESLQHEIKQALNETKELEKIAKRLQDKGIGKIAGKEEDQINKLGEDLERINREGKDLEKDKNKITQILDKHNLDQSDLHDELGRRASAVETILQKAGSGKGESGNNLDQIAQRIISQEKQLEDAEDKKLHEIKDEIRILSRILKIERQEMEALKAVEERMQQGEFGKAVNLLDNLVSKREQFGNKKDYSQIRKDLKDEKEIIKAIGELFHSIKMVENQGIARTRLYDEIASQGSFSSPQEAQNVLEDIENEFKEMEDEIKEIRSLRKEERKLQNLEHDKLKQIDDENSQLRKNVSPQNKQKLGEIHQKLQRLGFSLKNNLNPTGAQSNDTNSNQGQKPKDWSELLANPGKHIEPKDNLSISSDELVEYTGSRWCIHPNSDKYSTYKTPSQGFKFHITAYPDEAYDVCKALIPVLQNNNISHKIMKDLTQMTSRRENSNPENVQALKLMTIYPGVKKKNWAEQVFEYGKDNREEFYINEDHTRDILKYLLNSLDNSVLEGGPKLEGYRDYYDPEIPAKEYRAGKTRIHLTYSKVGGSERYVISNGEKNSILDWILIKENSDEPRTYKYREDAYNYYKLDESKFRESGSYRKDGNYKKSEYFLEHLVSRKKSNEIKKGLSKRVSRPADRYPKSVIVGLDGKISGAHYLPPPEGESRIQEIIQEIVK